MVKTLDAEKKKQIYSLIISNPDFKNEDQKKPIQITLNSIQESEFGSVLDAMEIETEVIFLIFIQYCTITQNSPFYPRLFALKTLFDFTSAAKPASERLSLYSIDDMDPESVHFISDIVNFVVPSLSEKVPELIKITDYNLDDLCWALFVYDTFILYSKNSDSLVLS
ncbi:hypothetical protein AYI68_g6409 [Smittium mucronatum]|uniref:Uncharacterized protein n=1 Tax=Smittium mucronatum TaxID=133383 RepID=A0A1R0GRP9_9FUNG|nr:hypothetical protein AYI68_g6409 [Smittium mucronatum]